MSKIELQCTYCKNNKCDFKTIINCKHRELMEENRNLDAVLQDKILEISKLDDKIGQLEKAFAPVLDFNLNETVSHDMLGMNAITAIQEAKRLYSESVERD